MRGHSSFAPGGREAGWHEAIAVACYTSVVMSRPLSRLRLLLPELASSSEAGGRASAARVPPALDVVARAIADGLAAHGVVTRHQLHHAAADGAPRADVALWFPDLDGKTVVPDTRQAPARVHVAVVVNPGSSPKTLARYDALLVPCASQHAAVVDVVSRLSRQPAVIAARLCGVAPPRDAEQAERGVQGPVVVVDLRARAATAAEPERAFFQLALRNEAATLVLVGGDDDSDQQRVRALADRHAVSAWLAAGPDGFASALLAADVVAGGLSWDETLLAALCRVAVIHAPAATATPTPLLSSLRDARVIDDIPGTLQLAATLDRRLKDHGALAARGLMLHEALLQPSRGLFDALAAVEPLPGTLSSSSRWQAVGPLASSTAVAAIEPTTTATPLLSTAQKIEDELSALKARMLGDKGTTP